MLTKAIAQTEKLLNQLDRRAVLQRQEDAAAHVKRWELADPRDRWKHTGEKQPHLESVELKFKPRALHHRATNHRCVLVPRSAQ